MSRRLWAALLRAYAYVFGRWADGANLRLLQLQADDIRELRKQIDDKDAVIVRLEADVEYQVAWRAREIAALKAETAARAAQQALAGDKRED